MMSSMMHSFATLFVLYSARVQAQETLIGEACRRILKHACACVVSAEALRW